MNDQLEAQLVNHIRSLLKPLNEEYKGFFHLKLITLCDAKDMKCTECEGTEQQCKRCVFAFQEIPS